MYNLQILPLQKMCGKGCANCCANMWIRITYSVLIAVVGVVLLFFIVDPLYISGEFGKEMESTTYAVDIILKNGSMKSPLLNFHLGDVYMDINGTGCALIEDNDFD